MIEPPTIWDIILWLMIIITAYLIPDKKVIKWKNQ